MEYIFLAAGCAAVGVVVTFVVLGVCQRLDIDINKHVWVLAIPLVVALVLNIGLLELWRKWRRRPPTPPDSSSSR